MKTKIRFQLTCILIVALALMYATSAFATIRYVKASASASNATCSSSKPCNKIEKALTLVAPGDSIRVATGTYTENLFIQNKNSVNISGSWNATFTAQSSADSTGASIVKPAVVGQDVIGCYHSTNIIIDSLHVVGNGGIGINVYDLGSIASATISNCVVESCAFGITAGFAILSVDRCKIHDCGENGIMLGSADEPIAATLTNNYIFNNDRGGIVGSGEATGLIANNIIYDNSNPSLWSAGISVGNAASLAMNVINNTVSGSTYGIALNAPNSVLANNIIANCYYGIESSGANTVITRNDLYNVQVNYTVASSTTDIYDNPLLTSTYHLSPGSACINAGASYPTYVPMDIDRDPRNTDIGGDGLFDIGADEYFNLAPTVMSTTPVNAATAVALTVTPKVTFSENIQPGNNYSLITLKNPAGQAIPIVLSITGTVLSIDPVPTLAGSTRYTVTIPAGGVNDLEGKGLAAPYQFYFTTARR